MSVCPDEDTLALFVDGKLAGEDEVQVRVHATRCDACLRLVADAGGASRHMPAQSPVSAPAHAPAVGSARTLVASEASFAGKYIIEGELGSGGMGRVLRARHAVLGHRVAIKLVHQHLLNARRAIQRFEREAKAVALLRSRHVPHVFDIDRTADGVPYIVMEYLEGRDLQEVVRTDGPPTAGRAITWILHAIDALAEAHGRGILHRDVKPANMFLTRDEHDAELVKVLDFGLAKALPASILNQERDASTATTGIVGSPHFMSPEQLGAQQDVDLRADIWSIGASLYMLLTGKPPFVAPTLTLLRARMLRAAAPLVSESRRDVPPELDAVVARCLRVDPVARWQSVDEIAAALRAVPLPATEGDDAPATIAVPRSDDGEQLADQTISDEAPPRTVRMIDAPTRPPRR